MSRDAFTDMNREAHTQDELDQTGTASSLLRMSSPPTTLPKTECLLSKCPQDLNVMKNLRRDSAAGVNNGQQR